MMEKTILFSDNSRPGNKPTSCLWKSLLVAVALLGMVNAKAQVAAYEVEQLPATPPFVPIPNTKTSISPPMGTYDSHVSTLTLPFPFFFNGSAQTTAHVSLNGFLTFGTSPNPTETSPMSNPAYSGVIAPFGADVDLITASAVHHLAYYVEGTAPNRILKIEWHANRGRGDEGTQSIFGAGVLVFQVWLYETTNVIEFHYQQHAAGSQSVETLAQVGIRGSSITDFILLSHTAGNWPSGSPGMAVSSTPVPLPGEENYTVRIKSGNPGPGTIDVISNRTFRFKPVTCFAPSTVNISSVSLNSATLSWSAAVPAPAGGYEYYYSTNAIPPNAGTAPSGSTAAGVTTANLNGLSPSTGYYVYVRSVCATGSEYSAWTPATYFTTGCPATTTPYILQFDPGTDSFAIPNLPMCTSRQQMGTGNLWVTTGASPGDGYFDPHLVYNQLGANDANVWFFTHGIQLDAGTVYRLSYEYGGSTEYAHITNRMEVAYGMAPSAAGMTTQLANHNNIKASPIENIINFTAPTTGVYYFGFRAYSAANNGKLFLDNIQLHEPGCPTITNATSFNISGQAASITWDAPSPTPYGGYAYYLSNVATPPSYTQEASGTTSPGTNVVTINGLSGNTTYYFWVRSVCGPGDLGEWSLVHSFTTLPQPVYTYCTPAPSSVDGQGIINVTVGSINNSTGVETGNYGNYSHLVTNIAQGSSVTVAITFNTSIYNYNTRIWIDWNNDSDFSDPGENVYYGLSSSNSPNTLLATFTVPIGAPLGEHRMRIGGADINDLSGYGSGQGPCYNGSWASFEDYTVNVVVPPPALAISSSTSTQCALTDSPLITLSSPIGNYNTYSWSPANGVTGDATTGWTFNSASTITYTLTATQTSIPFSTNTVSYTYVANELPTPIALTPDTASSCPGSPVQINATGGVVGGITVMEEDFNGTMAGWTAGTINSGPEAHTGGNVTASHWTLRPNGYNPGGASSVGSMSSNDATQFVISNSDGQGSSTRTHVVLDSPVFSLEGYTSASLSFFHYYKVWINGYARVMISTNGGTTWTQLLYWGNSLNGGVTQGAATNFAQVIQNLDAYVGQTNLRIRFEYMAQWGYVWAIDNFRISGSATSAITWTPVEGLYMDAALTTPYVAGTGTSSVYAAPLEATTYTASASTPGPHFCTTETTASIQVPALVAGVASFDQSVCSLIDDINLTGYSGTIVGWQSSADAAFTTPADIAGSAGSSVLTGAMLGQVSANTWCRAVLSHEGCTVYSNVVAITVANTVWDGSNWSNGDPDLTKAVVFNGNYSSTGNIDACSVTVQSGNVVINPGHTLQVQNSVVRTGGSLTFENNASLVQINDAAANDGYIVYKRNTTPVRRFDYTYWSSPLFPQTLVGLSPATLWDKYFQYNTAGNTWVNVAGNALMEPGKGYIIRAPQDFDPNVPAVFNGVFHGGSNDGVPNNGVISVPIVRSGANDLNLIGNPYPSAIDANLFYEANNSLIDGNFYFWTHNTAISNNEYSGSDYAVWNSTGGSGTAGGGVGNTTVPTGQIGAGQGFFVKSLANGTAQFNNSMRLINQNNIFYRMAGVAAMPASEKHRVWLEMKNNQGAYKQTLVGYVSGATNGRDNGFDGEVVEAGNVISLYSVLGADKLVIQGRALPFDIADIVPLGYRSDIAGNFEIALSDFDGLFTSQNIYLEDLTTGAVHDLKSGSYNFTTAPGVFENRFQLRYTNNMLGVDAPVLNPEAVVVYKDGQRNIQVNVSGFDMKSIQVYDIRGRLLYERNYILSDHATVAGLEVAEQILLVKVIATDGGQVSKKIIF